jgi:putative serine protease PepD
MSEPQQEQQQPLVPQQVQRLAPPSGPPPPADNSPANPPAPPQVAPGQPVPSQAAPTYPPAPPVYPPAAPPLHGGPLAAPGSVVQAGPPLGPLPPTYNPPAPGRPAAPGYPAPQHAAPGYAAPGYAAPGYAAAPGQPGGVPGQAGPAYLPGGMPFPGSPYPAVAQGVAQGVPHSVPGPKKVRRWKRAAVAAVVVLAVTGLVTWQAIRIAQLSHRLSTVEGQAAADRNAASAAAEAVASRVASLEKASFRPQQIAEAALPSVFRVKAGAFSGTAWAVGKPTASGGTYLFTNFHVIESVWIKGERKVGIEHGDLHFDATIVKADKDKDLAQLETTAKFPGLVVSRQEPHPGEPVVVVGAPLGLESSVTTGVVSSASRKIEGLDNPFIQFDAPINPGNSGGPVINAHGEVVGIASAKLRDAEGIGLAIPMSLACDQIPICTT